MAEEPEVPYDSGNPAHVAKRKKKVSREHDRELNDLRRILGMPEGRRFFWRLLEKARIYHPTHTAGDPYQTAFLEGHRNLGLVFLNDALEACPELYAQAMAEANASKKKENEADA